MYEEDENIIIIDIGTNQTKMGFGRSYGSPSIVPTCLGYEKPECEKSPFYWNMSDYYNNINKYYSYPIQNGIINKSFDMEKYFSNIIEKKLRIYPQDCKLFIIQSIFDSPDKNEKLAKLVFDFDYCGFKALYIGNQAVFPLISKGCFTGFSLESGEGITQLVPVYDGFALKNAAGKFSLSGRDLSEYISSLLKDKCYRFYSSSEINLAKAIKEKECYVAENFEEEKKKIESSEFILPDGKSLNLKEEKIYCPEALFDPKTMCKLEEGIVESCYNTIQKCDNDLKSEMFGNIVISGGNTNFKGFNNRFLLEMEKIVKDKFKIKIHDVNDKISAVWEGAKIFSMKPFMKSMWITKEEYEEYGKAILYRKCF